MKKILPGFLIVLVLFFTFVFPGSVLSEAVPFETLDIGEISYFRYGDVSFQGAELVIRDPGAWEWFWKTHTHGMAPSPPLPKVNFSREMVIAVVLGYQDSGGGPKIEITSIDEWPDPLDLAKAPSPRKPVKGIDVIIRQTRAPGPLTVITNPYHIVKVRNSASVTFEHQPADYACKSNADCGTGDFCEKKAGDCSGSGVCQVRPATCPLYFRYDPVCGCDGKTYDSDCAAAVAGVSVLYKGTCGSSSGCQGNNDCPSGQFCLFSEGSCSPPGACTLQPQVCMQIYAPVCGCDRITYANSCQASGVGVSILSQGPCP